MRKQFDPSTLDGNIHRECLECFIGMQRELLMYAQRNHDLLAEFHSNSPEVEAAARAGQATLSERVLPRMRMDLAELEALAIGREPSAEIH